MTMLTPFPGTSTYYSTHKTVNPGSSKRPVSACSYLIVVLYFKKSLTLRLSSTCTLCICGAAFNQNLDLLDLLVQESH